MVARISSLLDTVWVSVSATTRKPRPGEVDGVHYYFLSEREFTGLIEQDGFLEWARVHSNYYGTPRTSVEEHLKCGQDVILEIDVQGGLQVKRAMPEACLVFIEPPSLEELRRRLEGRGTESQDVIDERMKVALVELSQKMKYDYQLENDDLEKATQELANYIASVRGACE